MNLNLSYNWLKDLVDLSGVSPEEFARRASIAGVAVERLYPQADQFKNMVVGKILGLSQHPNADKLRVVSVDLGQRATDIVCGGSNLSEGMLVAVAEVGAQVRWHGQGDLITLEPAEIRGVKSDGMICAADEIGLKDAFPAKSDKEIVDLSWTKVAPGTTLAAALGYDDVVMDIEVTTNRPDAFAMVGIAREASAIFQTKLTWQPTKLPKPSKKTSLSVNIDTSLCRRYLAAVINGVTITPSPWWLQQRLLMAGLRPINNVVDVTNYVMLELGQPLHAFDSTSVTSGQINIREAKSGEALTMLDGSQKELASGMVIIADSAKPLAVAGVMGGHESGVHVDYETTSIILESATFDSVSVRRTARDLNLHTDAALRFSKGLPPELAEIAMARAIKLLTEITTGQLVELIDVYPNPSQPDTFRFRPAKAEETIGITIDARQMINSLESLGFSLKSKGRGEYQVTVPWWRAGDIEGERDFSEEIARLHGYHNLPSLLPVGQLPTNHADESVIAADELRKFFASAGFNEIITYSFTSEAALKKSGTNPADTIAVANPLTSDLARMRLSLIPGLLQTITDNQGLSSQGHIFEVSRIYPKTSHSDLPANIGQVVAACFGVQDNQIESVYRELRGVLSVWSPSLSTAKTVRRPATDQTWHPGRSADLVIADQVVATVGELHPALCRAFGVDGRVLAIQMDRDQAWSLRQLPRQFAGIPPYPPALRDLALVVGENVDYQSIESTIRQSAPAITAIELFDIYRGQGIEQGQKSLALHLSFVSRERTLTAEEVDASMAAIREALEKEVGAIFRG